MKSYLLACCGPLLLSSFAIGQERCASHSYIQHRESAKPGYKLLTEQQFETAKSWSETHAPKRATYTVPVVFHIVYNEPEENLHDSVILNQLAILNDDYGRQNSDTVNLRSEFSTLAGKTNIQFVLASVDPSGNPTTGITRTETSTTSFGTNAIFMGSFEDLEKVKSTADGGHDAWNPERYLNIWICNMTIAGTPMLLGYATPPANLENWEGASVDGLGDGVVLLYHCIGTNNPLGIDEYEVLGRTATHEVGHYLGLRHIWGDEDDCSGEDGIDDTPHAAGASEQDCNTSRNSCTDDFAGLGDVHDMIENFMDYSSEDCRNSFTKGQVALMHGVLENHRHDLVYNNAALGIGEQEIAMNCYPNPAKDKLFVTAGAEINSAVIYDLNGKAVKTDHVSGTSLTIDVQDLREGLYILRIASQDGTSGMQKFTVSQ